jgi:hypothetical protein
MAKQHIRISVGFQGGQVLSLRVTEEQLETLYRGLGDGGWHELQTEDGPVRVYLGQVVYVRTEDSDRGVGFSAV